MGKRKETYRLSTKGNKMKQLTKNEVLEVLENARDMMNRDILEMAKIGIKENPLICNISVARAIKTDYNSDIWVSIPMNNGMKVCQLKDIK